MYMIYIHIHVCKNVIGHLLSNLFGLETSQPSTPKGSHLCDLEMHGIYLNKGTTESPELVKVGVFKGMVFQDAVTFFKALIWLGPPELLEYLLVPNSCIIPCMFSRAGPGINFAPSRCCLTLKQRETKSDSFNYLQPSPLAGQTWNLRFQDLNEWIGCKDAEISPISPLCLRHGREFWDPRGVHDTILNTYSWTWVSEFSPGKYLYELFGNSICLNKKAPEEK